MTREEQLVFCKKCINRKMDMKQGLLCKLTSEKAVFTGECPDYNFDETVKERPLNDVPMPHSETMAKITDSVLEKLKGEQNFQMALITGIIVGIIGAVLWAAITVATEYQIGFMAIAIGAGVGFTIRYFGKGIDQIFGITGAIIAILSCFLGNFLSIIGFFASYENLGYIETLTLFDYSQFIPIMSETFGFMDILFYGFAAYEGYKFAFRKFTPEELLNVE